MRIFLGSQSPRRSEILGQFSLDFEQVSPNFDENELVFAGDPRNYVEVLSRGKAESLSAYHHKGIVITADTIVYKDGKVYGKSPNESHARQTLKELAGQWHTVLTAITVVKGMETYCESEETRVLFNHANDEAIDLYLEQVPWQDKAGAYMIQGAGSLLINRIEGSYSNVVGFPLNTLQNLLNQVGVNLWEHIS
jgi:septum formation protein